MLILYIHLPSTIAYIDLSFCLVRLVAPFFLFQNIAQVIGESRKETLDFISLQGTWFSQHEPPEMGNLHHV